MTPEQIQMELLGVLFYSDMGYYYNSLMDEFYSMEQEMERKKLAEVRAYTKYNKVAKYYSAVDYAAMHQVPVANIYYLIRCGLIYTTEIENHTYIDTEIYDKLPLTYRQYNRKLEQNI